MNMQKYKSSSGLYLVAFLAAFSPLLVLSWFLLKSSEDSLVAERVRANEQAEELLLFHSKQAQSFISEGNLEFEKTSQKPDWYEQLRKDFRVAGIRNVSGEKLRDLSVSKMIQNPERNQMPYERWLESSRGKYAPAFILFTLYESGWNKKYPLLEEQLLWEIDLNNPKGITLQNGVSILWNFETLPSYGSEYQWKRGDYDIPILGAGEDIGLSHVPIPHQSKKSPLLLLTIVCLGWGFSCLLGLLIYAKRKDREARESVDQLSAVAHELRTPLTGMKLLLERVINTADMQPKSMSYLSQIEGERQRLEGVMEQFLVQGKLNTRGLQLRVGNWQKWLSSEYERYISLGSLVDGISLDLLSSNASKVYLDVGLMGIVISNIIKNAQQYGEGSSIRIKEISEGNTVGFEVIDTGPGIESKLQQKIFMKYERGEMALSRSSEGLGLGLSLAKEIVELHNGKITLFSQLGEGTRVQVVLPAG